MLVKDAGSMLTCCVTEGKFLSGQHHSPWSALCLYLVSTGVQRGATARSLLGGQKGRCQGAPASISCGIYPVLH